MFPSACFIPFLNHTYDKKQYVIWFGMNIGEEFEFTEKNKDMQECHG